jgi:Reverse transcriptase (RNA-dependent DNA polymerase)
LFNPKKKSDTKLITQYRPISLINCSFKIITKLLSTRLTPHMDTLISYTQTTNIKCRNIMDNVVVATEILYQVRIKNKRCTFQNRFWKNI